MKVDELEALKYRQLQKLAKDKGVKANLPRSALIEALLAAFEPNDEKSDSVLLSSSSASGEAEKSTNSTIDLMTDESSSISSNSGSRRSSRKKASLEKPQEEVKIDLNISRRNSRLSRLFDKEAFEIEAAKVSRFAQQIVNSPRKRSSILNMTPLTKGQSTSAVNSPLVAPTPNKKILQKINSPSRTPLHKRPSMLKGTEIKKKKTVTLKTTTPGSSSVTKAKERTANTTGIPRPKKVPNFAAMHAKQFGQMDNLNQYVVKKAERIAALTPGPKKKPASSPSVSTKFNPNAKASINFTDAVSAPKKPFVFKAASSSKVLDNITNTKTNTAKYKPYTGKIKPLNAKEMSSKKASTLTSARNVKEQQMSIIKGVRMNKRMELMMKKRAMNK